MRLRTPAIALTAAVLSAGMLAGPAEADHTKGKKYRDFELTTAAAAAAEDEFGVAPEGSFGEGAMYLNAGKERFCLFLDFDVPEDYTVAALHLHEKDPSSANPQTGPIVIDASSLITDGTASEGCVTGDRATLRGVLSEPDDYYVNAHYSDGTPGELPVIRGNIGRN